MFENRQKGAAEGATTGGVDNAEGPSFPPRSEVRVFKDWSGEHVQTPHGTWAKTPLMKEMLERYPEGRLPLDETRRLYPSTPNETLNALGITDDRLRSYAFTAVRQVEERLLESGPVSPEAKEALIQRAADEMLKGAIANFSATHSLRLGVEETGKLFEGVPAETLAKVSPDRLRRIAFNATWLAEYQVEHETPLAAQGTEVLARRFARNMLNQAIDFKEKSAA